MGSVITGPYLVAVLKQQQTMNPMFLNACYYVNYDYEYLPSANNRQVPLL